MSIKRLKTICSALVIAGALPVWASETGQEGLANLPPADIYLLGEIHGNPTHHARQAEATAAIQPRALVFEMLSPEQADAAQDTSHADEVALEAALGWDGSGWPEFSLYYQIFAAVPDARLYGAALPRAEVRRAIGEGAAAVFGDDAARFGLDQPLPAEEQSEREALQDAAHCGAMPAEMLPGMVDAQRLRDASFARTALQALEQTGGPVVVITGNGHVHKGAMPAAFTSAAPDVRIFSLGQLYQAPQDAPFDQWIVSEAPELDEDPCAAFKN